MERVVVPSLPCEPTSDARLEIDAASRRSSPGLEASVTVTMTVAENGAVTGARVIDGTLGPAGDACLEHVVGTLRFNPGPSDGAMTYELALGFSPAH